VRLLRPLGGGVEERGAVDEGDGGVGVAKGSGVAREVGKTFGRGPQDFRVGKKRKALGKVNEIEGAGEADAQEKNK